MSIVCLYQCNFHIKVQSMVQTPEALRSLNFFYASAGSRSAQCRLYTCTCTCRHRAGSWSTTVKCPIIALVQPLESWNCWTIPLPPRGWACCSIYPCWEHRHLPGHLPGVATPGDGCPLKIQLMRPVGPIRSCMIFEEAHLVSSHHV